MSRRIWATRPVRRGGFSLLEVLLALAVLAAGLATVMFVFTAGDRSAVRARVRADLHLLAQMRLAQMESGEIDPTAFVGESEFPRKPGFRWSVETDDDADPLGFLRQVTLTVRYEGPDAKEELVVSRLYALRDDNRTGADPEITPLPAGSPPPTPPSQAGSVNMGIGAGMGGGNPGGGNPGGGNMGNPGGGNMGNPGGGNMGGGNVPPTGGGGSKGGGSKGGGSKGGGFGGPVPKGGPR